MATETRHELRENLAYMALVSALKGDREKSERFRRVIRRIDQWRASAPLSTSASHLCA